VKVDLFHVRVNLINIVAATVRDETAARVARDDPEAALALAAPAKRAARASLEEEPVRAFPKEESALVVGKKGRDQKKFFSFSHHHQQIGCYLLIRKERNEVLS
jgi:hypothetical protein